VSIAPAVFQSPLTTSGYLGGSQILADDGMGAHGLNGMEDSMMNLSEDLNMDPEEFNLQDYFVEEGANGRTVMF
jgi:hypothetical protein